MNHNECCNRIFPNRDTLQIQLEQFFRFFPDLSEWRGSLIKEEVHLQHAIATQQHSAPVSCTQALCWSPVLISSAIQALLLPHTANQSRNQAVATQIKAELQGGVT